MSFFVFQMLKYVIFKKMNAFFQNQEEELNKLKIELNSLRDEEKKLEQNIDGGKQQIALFAKSKQEIQQQVNQVRETI